MKKRLVAILLCLTMVCSVGACGNKEEKNTEGTEVESTQEIVITEKDLPVLKKIADYTDINAILTKENKPSADEVAQQVSVLITKSGIGFTKVTDRNVIQEGDVVKVDYTGYQNGEAFSGGADTDVWLNVSENCSMDLSTGETTGGFIDGFTAGLLGKKAGETVRYEVTFPENYGNEDLNGQTVEFEFVIHSIHTDKLITAETITDEMVKETFGQTYGVSTIQELEKYAEEQMNFVAIMDYLINNSTVEISDKYVEYSVNTMVDDLKEMVAYQYEGIDFETYLLYVYGCTVEDFISQLKEEMKEQTKMELLYKEIVKNEKLSLDEAEFKEYIVTILGEDATEAEIQSYYEAVSPGSIEDGKKFLENSKLVEEYFINAYRESVK